MAIGDSAKTPLKEELDMSQQLATSTEQEPKLRIPQARVLQALMPYDSKDPSSEWPILTREAMAIRAGYSPLSGSVTRALNGIKAGSSSNNSPDGGKGHKGILQLGYVETFEIEIEGIKETNYKITSRGISAFRAYIMSGKTLPVVRDAEAHTNNRYVREDE